METLENISLQIFKVIGIFFLLGVISLQTFTNIFVHMFAAAALIFFICKFRDS